jgi:Uma2 family endonuclease
MSASPAAVGCWSAEEYLTFERSQQTKHEYDAGAIFGIARASRPHNIITSNLIRRLGNALDGTCVVFSSNMRVKCPTGLSTYPDVTVVCGEQRLADEQGDTLLNPQVLIEVLSPSTEAYDRGKKFEHYRSFASLREYVLISQDHRLVEHFVRRDASDWTWREFRELTDSLSLVSASAVVPLAQIDAGI